MRLAILSLLCAVTVYGQGSQTPIYNGLLQSDLNAAGFKITLANLADYAGANLTWNVATNKFDATGGGGSGTVTNFSAGDLSPLFTTTEATTTTTPALSFVLTAAGANTVFGRAAGTSGAPTYSSSPQFTAIGNLTTNGFVKTGGGVGTLSVDTSTYLTANQNISLTGDVTGGPAATSIATTIGANKVTLAQMATMATGSILGRATALTGNVEVLTALPFAYTGDVTRSAGSNVTTLAAGNAGNLNSGTLLAARMPALTGDVTTTVGTVATTIAANAVTYGKMQTMTANRLLGSGLSGTAVAEITLGTNLSFTGTTLNATGGGGTPGGSTTQVQYNNASAFGGITNLTTDGTNVTKLSMGSAIPIQWSTDTGIVRNAAGILEINNGNAGQWGALKAGIRDAGTVSVTDGVAIGHQSSATASTLFGTGLLFNANDTTTADVGVGRLTAYWTTATHNSNVSKMGFQLTNGGTTLGEKATLTGAGIFDVVTGFTIAATASTGTILQGDGTKFKQSTATWPTTASTGSIVQGNGTNFVMSTATWPTAATTGKVVMGNGTNYVESTPTYPNAATPTARKIIVSDGTNWVPSTETWAVPGVANKVLVSDGTNWTSANLANAALTNSAITIAGTSVSLGGTITQDTITGLAANGIVKRTAANTLGIATAKTDYWDTTDMVGDSGGAGAHGLVPSPGAVAGTTKFLREDATWAVPAGGAGGSPGGSTTQVQYNNAGAFGGITNLTTDGTNVTGLSYGSTVVEKWSTDTGFTRNAANVMEVNNGTAGSYGDILARGLRTNAVLFANRIASPVEGTYQAFTDSTTNVSGATITGGGSNHVSGYYNGTNWVADSGNNGLSNVTNDAQIKASDFPSSSVDSEISLFSGTTGKAQKRATGTGLVTATSGVYGTTTTITGTRINPRVDSSTSASATTWAPNSDTTDVFELAGVLTVAVTTISNPSGTPVDGQKLMIRIKSDASARALTWSGTQWRASSDMALPTTTIASKTFYCGFVYNSVDTKWDMVAYLNNF